MVPGLWRTTIAVIVAIHQAPRLLYGHLHGSI